MTQLDANLLIALLKDTDPHHAEAVRVISGSGPFATSSVAWMEFLSKPIHQNEELALRAILTGGILPFEQETAALAGQLYHLTGSKRRTRLDSMIASAAILANATLATVNPDDFSAFIQHGLRLHSLADLSS